MRIIGVAGQLNNGKDEVADWIQAELNRQFGQEWERRAFADGLKDVVCQSFDMSRQELEILKRKKEIPPGFNKTIREALQLVGDDFRKIKSDVWIHLALENPGEGVILSDVRYINEMQVIHDRKGVNILVIRPDQVNDVGHPSESELKPLVDTFIDWDGEVCYSTPYTYEGATSGKPHNSKLIDYVIRNDMNISELRQKITGEVVPFLAKRFGLSGQEVEAKSETPGFGLNGTAATEVNPATSFGLVDPSNINFVPKSWGYESWMCNNEKYCGKLLFFKKGKRCSWHYHKLKDETFYLQSGELLVVYSMEDCMNEAGDKIEILALMYPNTSNWISRRAPGGARSVVLKSGDVFYVPSGLRHAMYGVTDTHMFEFSTQHFDEDSYRILKGD